MKQKILAIIGLAHIFIPLESSAGQWSDPKANYCKSSLSDSLADTITIDTIVIPPSLPAGSIVWRQPEQEFSYSCRRGPGMFWPEMFISQLSIVQSPDLELGIIYNGKEYIPSAMNPNGFRYPTGHSIPPQPAEIEETIIETRKFTLSVFLKTRARANPGEAKLPSIFTALTIGGMAPGQAYDTYRIDLVGMNNISQLPCASTVSIIPSTIDFGSISSSDAHADKEIKRIPFSIVDQRTCEKPTPYSLKGYLRPLDNSAVIDSRYTLVPLDNYSVGINIFETEGNKSVLFNEEFEISPKVNLPIYIKPFEARLKWRTSTPKFGKFNAGAILDIDYK
ncbi:fimbrial protein [Pseudomonas sp. BN102]|uniref:fimbrial protein n=1 Tax=Pseudomonas sp. BN102 TaxID=2567886 RepID=UPI002458D025|nr:fimbrial protein [Pseudomonas sp. BN102]MDH4610515.1 fimbrial protein [Pseudomonas sp. BN102]